MARSTVRVGTRGSRLALAQANAFKAQLIAMNDDLSVEIVPIKTSGDEGKRERLGAFVREIQEALLDDRVDIALHCLKDLPTEQVSGLRFSAYLEREDARETLISRGPTLGELSDGSVVGTGSLRRTSQLNATRPGLTFRPLVGNVDTRLRKLIEAEYDAIVLAYAGLKRLGVLDDWEASDYSQLTIHHFAIEELLPAPGQAIIVAETRESDAATHAEVSILDHSPSRICGDAERAFLKTFGGGCSVPVAAFASIEHNQLALTGLVASPDGRIVLRDQISGHIDEGDIIAERLSENLGERGAFEIVAAVGRAAVGVTSK